MGNTIRIREATLADAALLSEIERNSPLEFADGSSLAIDRGDDYFASARLMGSVRATLAEVDGEPAGVFCTTVHPALIGGERRRMLYFHHTRILPRFQGLGIGKALADDMFEHWKGRFDSPYWYISPLNAHSQAFARSAPNKWSFGPAWVSLPCEANAGPPCGRPATREDADEIVSILNTGHEGEEMFLPYTADSLAERLGRDPEQYGWSSIWIAEGAVVGVWPEGNWIGTRVTGSDGTTTFSRSGGAVLDYGFLPGAGGQLRDLLRAWCSWLLEREMGELTVFTSIHSRSWPVFQAMSASVSQFDFWTAAIQEPAHARERGLYVDHIYF